MKRIDASKEGIFDLAWSKDSTWLTYVANGNEVRLANVQTGEIRIIGEGTSPGITAKMDVVLERKDEIIAVSAAGEKLLLGLRDLVSDAPKRNPLVSPSGDRVAAVVCNVFDKESEAKNAYPHRHFVALIETNGERPILTAEQWYGGTMCWFPDSEKLAHFEFDSTGGPQTHIIDLRGQRLGTLAGVYPGVAPDGNHIAVRPRGGGGVVIYSTKKSWSNEDVETQVMRIPSPSNQRLSATPPIWVDTRFVLVDEGDSIWRIDTKRDKPEELKKLPQPTHRRRFSMIASPNRELLAMEVSAEGAYDLRVMSLI